MCKVRLMVGYTRWRVLECKRRGERMRCVFGKITCSVVRDGGKNAWLVCRE